MKKSSLASHQPLFLVLTLALLAVHTQAQSLYWDINDTTPGSGGPAPSGVWDFSTLNWNNAAGDASSSAWTNSGLESAIFAAGTDATDSYSITLGAGTAVKLSALTLNTGALTLTPQSTSDGLDFGTANAALNVAGASSLSITSFINGSAGLTKAGTGIAILSSSSLPTGAYAVQAGELQLSDGVTVNAGALTIGGAAGASASLTLGSGAVFNLGGNITYSSANAPLAGLVQGGTVALNDNRTLTVQNITADLDFTIQSVITDGAVSSGLTKAGGGNLLLSGANTYTGATTINASSGTLFVQGDSASIATGSALNIGAGAIATLGSSVDSVAVNRLGDAAAITLAGGAAGGATLNYNGANFATQTVHAEAAGVLTLAGNHRSTLTLTPGGGDEVALTFASLTREDHAVALVRGSNLGAAAGTVDSARVFFATEPTLSGGILSWMLGDTSATGIGTGFVTYDAVNGLRLLAAGEYTAPGSATTGSNVLKSAAGAQAVSSSVVVSSWTSTGTGTTTLGAGVTLGIASGGVLFTANATISGGTLDLASSNDGIIHLARAGALTAVINSVITGENGITLSGTGTGNKILALGGDNTFTGGVRLYGGILQLNHAGALNASGINTLAVQNGTLRLNGNNITVASLNGAGSVVNAHADNAATLRVTGTGTLTGALNNGGTATLSLTKTGNGLLSLQGNNQFTGATVIEQGVLRLGGGGNNGRLSGTTAITISQGATLRVTNTNGNNVLADRVNDAAVITLSGGTFDFDNSANANADYTETVGAVILNAGASQITADQAAENRTSTLIFTSVTRQAGATLNFTGGGSGLGLSTRNRLDVGGLAEGFIGGWATVGNEFARYITDIDSATAGDQGSVAVFAAGDYSTLTQADWTSGLHVKPTADQTLNGSREAASANLTAGIDLNLGTHTLTLISGGLIKQGGAVGNNNAANRSQITNGTLTAGTTADAELFARVTGANLNITATIADNVAGAVHLVKTGTGTLFLGGASTYSGSTMVHAGTLTVGVGGDGSSAAQAGAAGRTGSGLTTVNTSATLTGTGLIQGGLALNGGTLRPGDTAGNATGTLWVGGDATFTSGSIALQITSTSQLDRLHIGGSFDWATGAGVVSLLNNGYTPTAGDVFHLLDWAQVLNAENVSTSTGLELFDLGEGFLWDTSLWATHGQLVVSIPEPSRALLMLAGISFMSLRRRAF